MIPPIFIAAVLGFGNLLSLFLPSESESSLRVGNLAPELQMTLRDDSSLALSDFQGKWVLVQFGANWSPSAEAMANIFSNIREKLDGYPFEFIQIYWEPTVLDGDLFGFSQFAGVSSVLNPAFQNLPYTRMQPSQWFLVDPSGIVKAFGDRMDGATARKVLSKAWAKDSILSSVDLASPEVQRLGEEMLQNQSNANLVVELTRRMLVLQPDNQLALRYLFYRSISLDGPTKASRDFQELIKGIKITEPTELYLDIIRHKADDSWENRQKLRAWHKKYPDSEYIESLVPIYTRLPEDLTARDIYLMNNARGHCRYTDMVLLEAYNQEWQGNQEAAHKLFASARRHDSNITKLDLINSLVRLGSVPEAKALIKQREGLSPENASPAEAWESMFINLVLRDLDRAKAYALAYQRHRPEKAQGFLMEWLILALQGQPTSEIQAKTTALIQSSERYAVAASLLEKVSPPDEQCLTEIPDSNIRLDTALFFVLSDFEAGAAPNPSLLTAQISFIPSNFPYGIINFVRENLFANALQTDPQNTSR